MQNPFLFESEYLDYEPQFEDASEFFAAEYADREDEIRRRRRRSRGGSGRSPARARRSRPRTGSGRRPRPPRPRYQSDSPSQRQSGGSFDPPDSDPPDSGITRLLQSLLNRALGLNLPEDGEMSVETRSAIRSFRSRENLPAGSPPAPTDRSAFANFGQRNPQSELYDFEHDLEFEEEINRQSAEYGRWIQQSLNKISGLRLVVDGIVGTNTRSAIRSFQSRQGLTVDGIVGPLTESALIRAGASQPPGSAGTSPAPYIPPSTIPKGGSVPGGSPVSGGRVTSPFGMRVHPISGERKLHAGMDIGGLPVGSPVNAAAAGQVVFAADNGCAGNNVKVDHGNGYLTSYMHLDRISVSKGHSVRRGQKIGELGQTGCVTGPHLHYEVHFNGTAIDPAPFVNG